MNIKTIEAKKHEEITGAVKVNSNMNITDVKEQDLPLLKSRGLSIEFDFKTKYIGDKDKNMAEINIDGNVIFMGEESEKILKSWKKDKTIPADVKFQVIRIVSDKCSKKAIMLSDDLQLPPPPLMMPQARRQPENK